MLSCFYSRIEGNTDTVSQTALTSLKDVSASPLHPRCGCSTVRTHTASLQQQLAFAETIGAVGELHQSFLGLMSDGGVSSLVQLLT